MYSKQVGVVDGREVIEMLKIPEILEHILTFCGVEDLKSCRLVSKLWRDSSLKAWQLFAWIVLSDKAECDNFQQFIEPQNATSTVQLYINFKISGGHGHFWGICGPHIKHVDISNCHLETTASIRHAVFNCCPNLQNLKLRGLSSNHHSDANKCFSWHGKYPENTSLRSLDVDHTMRHFVSWNEIFHRYPYIQVGIANV